MSILSKTDNIAYWTDRVKTNRILEIIYLVADHARATAKGTLKKSQFVSGIAGIGKTYVYEQTLIEHGVPYEVMRTGSVLGMVNDFHRCARGGRIVILDDPKKGVVTSDDFLNLLLAATGPEPRRYPYVIQGKKEVLNFDGLIVILLTNYSLREGEKAVKTVSEALAPLMTRVLSDRVDGSRMEVFEHSCYMAIVKQMFQKLRTMPNLRAANTALEYLAENMHVLHDVSCRTLVKIIELQQQLPESWRRTMDRERAIEPYCRPYVGELPQIILGK